MSIHRALAIIASVSLMPAATLADELTGSTHFLCTGWQATRCLADGTCETQAPWKLNIPDFVEVDLDESLIVETGTHVEKRTTEIDVALRQDGLILMHGQQQDRAWSWVINEASGEGTLTVSSQGAGVLVFSACTSVEQFIDGQ